MLSNDVLFAFGLTVLAGLATGVGSILALVTKTTNTKFLSLALGFSAGVMIYVSMVEIFAKARMSLEASLGVEMGAWVTVASFFGGILVIALIDRFIPSETNPHEVHKVEDLTNNKRASSSPHQLSTSQRSYDKQKLARMGKFTAIAIVIHNFPEGLATFITALHDPSLGIAIAVAIAIHNIPEGIAVSVPIYYATGSRKKAFVISFLSGLAEPVGAIIGYFILMPFINEATFGIIFAGVAGIMVFISIDELLPAAREYGEAHQSILGFIAGMAVMALSLLLFI